MKISEPVARLLVEYEELSQKLELLRRFQASEAHRNLEEAERSRILLQEHFMACYQDILKQRLDAIPGITSNHEAERLSQ